MIKANTDISNRQYIYVNKAIRFIDDQNFHGDVYQEYRKKQIDASKLWIKSFLPDKKDVEKALKSANKVKKSSASVGKIRAETIKFY